MSTSQKDKKTTSSTSPISLGNMLANAQPKQVAEFILPITPEEGMPLPISASKFNVQGKIPGKKTSAIFRHLVTAVSLTLVQYPSRRLENLGAEATGISFNVFGQLIELDKEGQPVLGNDGLPIIKDEKEPRLLHSYRIGLSKWASHLFPNERAGVWEPELRGNSAVPSKVPVDENGAPRTYTNASGTKVTAPQVPDRDFISFDVDVFNAILVNAPAMDNEQLNIIIADLNRQIALRIEAEKENQQASIQQQAQAASQQKSADF